MLDNLEDESKAIRYRQVSCSDIKSTSKPFHDAKDSKIMVSTSPFK